MTQRNVVKSLLVVMTAVFLGACSESYPGLEFDHTQGHNGIGNQESWSEDEKKIPIMVFTSEQDVFNVKTTRGIGAFENEPDSARLRNSKIHVFAFRSQHYTSGDTPELLVPADFRYYTEVVKNGINVSSNYFDENKVNCMLDGTNYNYGLEYYLRPGPTKLLHTSPISDAEDSIYYYGTVHQNVPFNFFAYYLDNAKVLNSNPRGKDGVSYELELDGTQDIMCGVSKDLKKEIEQALSTDPIKRDSSSIKDIWSLLNETDKNRITNLNGYCATTAHVGIHPMVQMKHELAQLRFTAYPGDTTSNRVRITGIRVKSKYKGRLTVASYHRDSIGFKFYNDSTILSLHEKWDGQSENCPPFNLNGYLVPFDKSKGDWKKQDAVPIGSCLLLPPDSTYTLYIDYEEKIPRYKEDSNPPFTKMIPLEYTLRPTTTAIFESGHYYPVNIVIYGSREIKVMVDVTPWEHGGDIEIDDPEQ